MTDDNIIRLPDESGLIPAHFYSDAASNPLFLAGERVDGRRRIALRYRALCESFVCDLGGSVTTGQSSLVTLAAAWTVQSEMLVAKMLSGDQASIEDHVRVTNGLVRVLSTLGLRRAVKDITPKATIIDAHAEAVKGAQDGV